MAKINNDLKHKHISVPLHSREQIHKSLVSLQALVTLGYGIAKMERLFTKLTQNCVTPATLRVSLKSL